MKKLVLIIGLVVAFCSADSLNMKRIGYWHSTGGNARGVHTLGEYAYVAADNGGLWIIDISSPAHPDRIGSLRFSTAMDVHVRDTLAYVASYMTTGFRVINVSKPTSPSQIGSCDTPGQARGVFVSGDYAYVADTREGVRIIDVTNPSEPREVGHYATPGHAWRVWASDTFAYVADNQGGLRILSIADPEHPYEIGFHLTSGQVLDVFVSDTLAYITDIIGLRIINISNPRNPTPIGSVSAPGQSFLAVKVLGNLAYVAADGQDDCSMRVIDCSNPTNPMEAGYYDVPGFSADVSASGNYGYLISNSLSFHVLEYCSAGIDENAKEPGLGFRLAQNRPNPFSRVTTIRYQLSRSAHTLVRVCNTAGEVIRTLVSEPQKPGCHTVFWDGKDETGKAMSSGIYFCQLHTGNRATAKRMILAR